MEPNGLYDVITASLWSMMLFLAIVGSVPAVIGVSIWKVGRNRAHYIPRWGCRLLSFCFLGISFPPLAALIAMIGCFILYGVAILMALTGVLFIWLVNAGQV